MKYSFSKILLVAMVAFLFTGCGLKYTIKDPVVSNLKYDKGPKKQVVLQVIDQRTDMVFYLGIGGLSNANVKLEDIQDPIAWLTQALEKEFKERMFLYRLQMETLKKRRISS